MPWIYQTYFKDKDYYHMFGIGQKLCVWSETCNIFLALGWHKYLYIPTNFLYVFVGSFASTVEGAFFGMPTFIIFTKLIPTGIEGTIMCFYTTITGLMGGAMRETVGFLWNDTFFHVTNEDMTNYASLRTLSAISCLIPLILIYRCNLIPTLA